MTCTGDTAGQERFRTITQSYYRGADAILVVFDISDRESFESCANWIQDIDKANFDCIKFLIGNKSDLEKEREVTYAEAKKFCSENTFGYFETSAKTLDNVHKTFENIAESLLLTGRSRQGSAHITDINVGDDDDGSEYGGSRGRDSKTLGFDLSSCANSC